MNPSSILVFHAGALGDLVNTAPAIQGLRDAFPDAVLTAAGNLSWLTLAAACNLFDETLSLEAPGMHSLFSDREVLPETRSFVSGFDLAVSWIRSPLLVENLINTGVQTAAFTENFPPMPGSEHVSDILKKPVMELGISSFPDSPSLEPHPQVIKDGPSFPGILVHPGSGSHHKNWPVPRFIQAAKELAEQTGLKTALVEGPADALPAKEFRRGMGSALSESFAGLSSLHLAALLKSAKLAIGNDSGVMHLAGALGTPAAAVFGPTDPGVWGVAQKNAINLEPSPPCSPCSYELMRKCSDKECLESIDPEIVVSAGMELIESGPTSE